MTLFVFSLTRFNVWEIVKVTVSLNVKTVSHYLGLGHLNLSPLLMFWSKKLLLFGGILLTEAQSNNHNSSGSILAISLSSDSVVVDVLSI